MPKMPILVSKVTYAVRVAQKCRFVPARERQIVNFYGKKKKQSRQYAQLERLLFSIVFAITQVLIRFLSLD
ncbi:MAG TPA: hypothetical protein DEQ25_17490 [Methylophaga sp.]|nr:hypothetical protein [Methylophaga sp.]